MSDSCPLARQSALRAYPLQFLVDFAAAVIDDETGELLEYRHLIQRPKYKKDWGFSFGNEIGRLAQGMSGRNECTDTLKLIDTKDIPNERWKSWRTLGLSVMCDHKKQKSTEPG